MATFNGTEGNDTIVGGADNDIINGNGGNDVLGGGDGSDTVSGGAGNDSLSGNAGADWVEGGLGNDEVRGGAGQDSIAFHEFGAANADMLTDFDAGWDNIQLDAAAFMQIGATGRMAVGDARFFSGTAAHDADDRIIYDATTGQLWYDPDGNGAAAQQLIATISNHSALSATDIWVFGTAPTGQTINGTAGDDTLVGGAGNDTINGLAGNDSLVGGDGDDSLNGGDGNDTLVGGNGADTLNGGLGDDTYIDPNAGEGDTIVDAGGVDTEIVDNVGGVLMAPGMENLLVRGTTTRPDPTVTGNELDNHIELQTDRGYWINGGAGNDTILGSEQTDIFTLGIFPSGDFGHDVVDGRGGIDIILANTSGNASIDMRAGTATISTAPASSMSFTSIEKLYGASGNDLLIADDGGRYLAGQQGNDTLIGGAGNDTLGGDDTFDFPSEPNGFDSLVGGAGNDVLSGGRGNDTLDGGTGNDTLTGGNDIDEFHFSVAPGAADADRIMDFETGRDSIVLHSSAMAALGASGSFSAGDARFYAAAGATAGHDADDRVVYDTSTGNLYYDADGSGAGAAQLIATLLGFGGGTLPEPSSLVASDIAVDTVTAARGQTINGTAGNDSLTGGAGSDAMFGGDGNDTLHGGDGNDTIFGGAGDDSLVGGPGADSMDGGDGNDTLDGLNRPTNQNSTGYNDVDVDTMNGGAGNDTYYVDNPNDVLIDSGGIDTVVATNVNWTLGAGFENLTVMVDDEGGGGTGNELDNIIDGTHAFKVGLNGMGGNDLILSEGKSLLSGGDGNDTLMGAGLDTLDGGNGDDVLFGHQQTVLTGGAGADTFVLGRPGISLLDSSITDFASGVDTIQLDARVMTELGVSGRFTTNDPRFFVGTAAHDADDRIIYDGGSQLFYDPDGNGAQSAILIANTAGHTVTATDLVVINGTTPTPTPAPIPPGSIVGTSGNDNLSGTNGNDSIFGLGGNDTIFANGGNDWVQGGAGNDSVSGGSGQDQYAFAEFGAANADQILNFDSGWDGIQLDAAGFSAIGATGRFAAGDVRFFAAAGATGGHDADDRIVYNTSTGQLFYDADGSGAGTAQLIATFQGAPVVAATDINVFGTATPSPTPSPTPTPGAINGTAGNDSLVGTAGNDTINGLAGDDTISGLDGNDSLDGGDGNDSIIGGQGIDMLVGGAGNDTLDAMSKVTTGPGPEQEADTLSGGLGDDTYLVSVNDVILADPGGIDTVIAFDTDWTLGDGLDNLKLAETPSGSGFANGTGNALDNVIDASGLEFSGTLSGLAGNDTLIGAQRGGTLLGGAGNDVLRSVSTAHGVTFDGGAGNDTLTGTGAGDTYVFDVQPGAANADLISTFATNVDKIQLDGSVMSALGGSGGFSAGDVRFYAAAGATGGHDADDRVVYDTTTGQLFYDADGSGASVAQLIATLQGAPALAATDISVVNGSTTPTPGTTLNGTAGADTLIGTAGNDTIWGNSGNDWIEGRGGNDQLSGGSGQDSYVFREFGASNADTLLNFDSNWDAMRFDSSAFTALGGAGQFTAGDARFYAAAGATGGHDADDRIVYNTSTGQLYYDADGAGGADAQLVATVQGAGAVAASDIWVI